MPLTTRMGAILQILAAALSPAAASAEVIPADPQAQGLLHQMQDQKTSPRYREAYEWAHARPEQVTVHTTPWYPKSYGRDVLGLFTLPMNSGFFRQPARIDLHMPPTSGLASWLTRRLEGILSPEAVFAHELNHFLLNASGRSPINIADEHGLVDQMMTNGPASVLGSQQPDGVRSFANHERGGR